jgi:hypothetical protein
MSDDIRLMPEYTILVGLIGNRIVKKLMEEVTMRPFNNKFWERVQLTEVYREKHYDIRQLREKLNEYEKVNYCIRVL